MCEAKGIGIDVRWFAISLSSPSSSRQICRIYVQIICKPLGRLGAVQLANGPFVSCLHIHHNLCVFALHFPMRVNVTCFAFERGRVRKGRWLWRKLLSVSVERDEREAGSATSATTREEASARAGSAASARTQVVV